MSRLHAEWFEPGRGGERCAPAGTRALVIGGGIAGIAAATVLCERGVAVTLLEREAQLGGRASSFTHVLSSGQRVQMERGFHAFFRQYYNLRALLRRVDPELAQLQPLSDYPILGPGGDVQTFSAFAHGPLWLQIPKLALTTPFLRLTDLPRIDGKKALAMVSYDEAQTYAAYDGLSAADYLDSLNFPKRARRMLFDVFSHSFFCPERELSAGELLMMFHHYFTGNPEGLVFDVARRPMSDAFWTPFEHWLTSRGAEVLTGSAVHSAAPREQGGYRIEHAHGAREADLLVLALDVKGIKALFDGSPEIGDRQLRARVERLAVTRPFFVLRLWLDRPLKPSRAPFAGTTGLGRLDNISIYDRFQDESAAYHAQTGGSVVELHAYAVDEGLDERALRTDLIAGLHAFYPESRACRIVDECMLLRSDASAFPPGGYADRPTPATHAEGLAICGDYTRAPFPCALMERAASSGMLAANTLLARYGVAPEPLRSVPARGLLAGLRRAPNAPRAMRPSHVG
jgi:isorenieratene synthase